MDFTIALQKLASYRPRKNPTYKKAFADGLLLLNNDAWKRRPDSWEFLESLALAALDSERYDASDRCIKHLVDKFGDSPRVEVLSGIRIEATEKPETALEYYNKLLESDPTNAAAWRRKAYVLRTMGKLDKSVEELSSLLDTFYNEVDGWVELAEIYYLCSQYNYALQALSHALLLAPQNPFYVLEFAEIAHTSGDIPLAIRTFLMVVDMTDDEAAPTTSYQTDITLRAWYGVKLSLRRLTSETRSPSQTAPPNNPELIGKLATERLRQAYEQRAKGTSAPESEDDLLEWASTALKPPPRT
ncbi:TPR-like protein [Thelephora terrestris]|uniref:ER membrane protein complex subunit 2 n=1 Tax=Thelephora terrestris TaxID=56493 RepID=A0A9P6HJE0_9AGAM|nr:TPR-like protein [Thelephora terrestris]